MSFWLVVAAAFILAGCAVAIGAGSTACLELDTRSAISVDRGASWPQKQNERVEGNGGVNCRSGAVP